MAIYKREMTHVFRTYAQDMKDNMASKGNINRHLPNGFPAGTSGNTKDNRHDPLWQCGLVLIPYWIYHLTDDKGQ